MSPLASPIARLFSGALTAATLVACGDLGFKPSAGCDSDSDRAIESGPGCRGDKVVTDTASCGVVTDTTVGEDCSLSGRTCWSGACVNPCNSDRDCADQAGPHCGAATLLPLDASDYAGDEGGVPRVCQ